MPEEPLEESAEVEEEESASPGVAPAAKGFGTALVIFTTIFLLLGIGAMCMELYSVYDFFKSPTDVNQKEAAISNK